MDWIVATLISALLLGCYDLACKHAVRDNAVLPVLFFANVCSATVWAILLSLPALAPGTLPTGLLVSPLNWFQHAQLLFKSTIVAASWICTYFAVKNLPVSLASPIRATSPIWTLVGAVIVLGERPTWLEGLGIMTTLGSFVGLSLAGRREGIHFNRNKLVWYLVLGTLFGAVSGLYDKYLLGTAGFDVPTVQCWFGIYSATLFLPLAVGWKLRWWPRHEFEWRWSILWVSLFLLAADYLYFSALHHPEALVSLVASLRRGSTLVAFAGGLFLFKEKNGLAKLPAVLGVVVGIILTILG